LFACVPIAAPWADRGKRCVDWHDDPLALEAARRAAARKLVAMME